MLRKLTLVMLAALALVGCASQPGDLQETRWRVTALNSEPLVYGSQAILSFGASQVEVWSSCVPYLLDIHYGDGNALTLGNAWDDGLICVVTDEHAEQEESLFDALRHVERSRLRGKQLTLLDGDGAALLTLAPDTPRELGGTRWALTTPTGLVPSKITLEFGRILFTGYGGCNLYLGFANWSDDGTLEMGEYTREAGWCFRQDQEDIYLKLLLFATRYEIDGDRLTLFSANGTAILEYQREHEWRQGSFGQAD